MLVRWLAPVVTILALVVQSAGAFAAAGVKNDVMCCCESIEACECHEHDAPTSPTHLNRCGGAVHEDPPIVTAVALLDAPALAVTLVAKLVATVESTPLPVPPTYVPEKPPF